MRVQMQEKMQAHEAKLAAKFEAKYQSKIRQQAEEQQAKMREEVVGYVQVVRISARTMCELFNTHTCELCNTPLLLLSLSLYTLARHR